MALTRQQKMPRGSSDFWDESLFNQAVDKARTKNDTLQQVAGEALLQSHQSKFLPLVVSSKLLLPLTGIFAALLITATWQSGLTTNLTAKLTPGHEYLGAVGVMTGNALVEQVALISQQTNNLFTSVLGQFIVWPTRAQNLTATVTTASQDIISIFGQSLNSFKQGIVEIYLQVKISIINIFNSFNQSFFDLYDNLLSGIGFLADRIELAIDSLFRPVKTSAVHGWQESVATVAGVTAGYNKLTADLVLTWSKIKAATDGWWQSIIKSWREFMAGFSSDSATTVPVDQEVKSDVKEIKQDIKSLIESLNQQSRIVKPNRQGLVVVPATGVAETDAEVKARLADMFSDPVKIKFDESGQAGIITPIFTEGDAGDYLFLLAPIKQ